MVLINTGTTGKLNRSTVPPRSSTNPASFTQFSFTHRINPKEWKRIGVFYYFQGQFPPFQGQFYKIPGHFQDKWHYFEIPGVFQDQGQIQGLFQVCANPAVLSNGNEVSCSRTQHRAPAEDQTHDLAIKSLTLSQLSYRCSLLICLH